MSLNEPEYNSPLEFFLRWEKETPSATFLRQPFGRQWRTWTFAQAGAEARKVASYLRQELPPDSRVAILSKNCAHWIMTDLAIMMAGHTSVPIYPTLTSTGIGALLAHADCQAIVIGKLDDFQSQEAGIPSHLKRLVMDAYRERVGEKWSRILETFSPLDTWPRPNPTSVMTIMYSSGTTGVPKGVMLSHGGLAYVGRQVAGKFEINAGDRLFSYLPLSHIAERGVLEMPGLYAGCTISFAESLETFAADLASTQPTLFGGVPRIWAKFHEGVLAKLPDQKLNRLLSIPLVGGIIRRSIKKKLGLSKARIFVSGAAPIPLALLQWYSRLGIFIREVYGMTENYAYAFMNDKVEALGSVGTHWPDVACRLGPDGEIEMKSKVLMLGYFRNPDATRETFTPDGFLRTGDKGTFDANGNLHIIGRVKDQFKTDKGKYISPAPIEMMLLTEPLIDQACVVGMGVPQPMCILTLSEHARSTAKEIVEQTVVEMVKNTNAMLESFEQIKCAIILQDSWTIENGFLTPSLKIKRNEIEGIYLSRYSQWYYSGQSVVWL